MNNKITFNQFPGDYNQRKKRKMKNKILIIVSLFLLVIVLSILSTILNLWLNK